MSFLGQSQRLDSARQVFGRWLDGKLEVLNWACACRIDDLMWFVWLSFDAGAKQPATGQERGVCSTSCSFSCSSCSSSSPSSSCFPFFSCFFCYLLLLLLLLLQHQQQHVIAAMSPDPVSTEKRGGLQTQTNTPHLFCVFLFLILFPCCCCCLFCFVCILLVFVLVLVPFRFLLAVHHPSSTISNQ